MSLLPHSAKKYNQIFSSSMLCIQDELSQLSLQKSSPDSEKVAVNIPVNVSDSSPDTPQQAFADKGGWMNSVLFGCLRPVLSIIGKAGVNEIKGNQGRRDEL